MTGVPRRHLLLVSLLLAGGLAGFGLAAGPVPVAAAEATPQAGAVLSGRVTDAETGEPVPYAQVLLVDLQVGALSGEEGEFVLRSVPAGSHRLAVTHLGYETYHEDGVRFAAGDTVWRAIALQPHPVEAEEVTVTAARREQTVHLAPASVVILRSQDLRDRGVVTFDQALEAAPGVSIYRSGGISVQSLSIRGSSDVAGAGVGNRVLLLIDGRPALTPDAGGALWSLVPVQAVDRVEIVKGAFSSLYGSTAMGGVVNVITRRPGEKPVTTLNLAYGFFERPPPAGRFQDGPLTQHQVDLTHSGRRGPLGILVNLSEKGSDGYSENTAYRFTDFFGKALYDLRRNRSLELTLSAARAENDYPHPWLSNLLPYRVRADERDDRQEKRTASADLLYWAVPGRRTKYSSRFYYYRHDARSFFNEPYQFQTLVDADKLGNLTQLDFALNPRHYLLAGLDLQLDRVESSPDTVMYGDHRVTNAAVYAQHEARITPEMTATWGLRVDRSQLAGGKSLGQLSPKLAVVYRPREELSLRLLLGQAFRAPSIAERFFQYELGGGTRFKPNPALKAERMDLSLETGLRWHLGGPGEIDLAYYRYHYEDMIYWVDITAEEGVPYTLFQVRNLKRASMQGVEASWTGHWRQRLSGSLAYAFMDAQDRSPGRSDDVLAYRVRHALSFSGTLSARKLLLGLSGRYQGRVEEVFFYPLDAPHAFLVLDAKATLQLTEGRSAWLAVHNLLDKAYQELERYPMPGRSWVVGVSAQF